MTRSRRDPGRVADVGLVNLRDAGGHQTLGSGLVRHGLLYRSSVPCGLSPTELAGYGRMGLRTIVDLRSPAEREAVPAIMTMSAEYFALDVLADAADPSSADFDRIIAEPSIAGRLIGESVSDLSRRRFSQLVRLQSARESYGRVFELLADRARLPALIHCSTGKDRTGWAISALLSLLDVAHEDVVSDYLLSAELLEPSLIEPRRLFLERGGDAELFEALMGVRRENLETAFEEVARAYGSFPDYFETGLGIDRSTQLSLRRSLVESH